MIIVKLMGGLGNQMFQYAFGRYLSLKNNSPIYIQADFLTNEEFSNNSLFTNREYQLDGYKISGILIGRKKIKRFLGSKNKIPHIRRKTLFIKERDNYGFQNEYLKLKGNIYLEGYWQSEKYFKEIESILYEEYILKKKLTGKNLETSKIIQDSECSVSIHIRRGDYISNPIFSEVLGACSMQYYQKAIEFLRSKNLNIVFFIFSDEIDWAKSNLDFITEKKVFVDQNDDGSCYEDMRLMSLCQHNIIANSSFSWWGAWLNRNISKIVIAPKKWYNDRSIKNPDLIPESWIKL
jgi:hypothetical protein